MLEGVRAGSFWTTVVLVPPDVRTVSYTVCLSRVVLALSDALDLVGMEVVQHGKRVAVMTVLIGRELAWTEDHVRRACLAALLHDFGVSSTAVHRHLVTKFDWEGSEAHCERGYELLRRSASFRPLAEPIRYHHTPWQTFDLDRIPGDTALLANTIFLADRVDALTRNAGHDRGALSPGRAVEVLLERGTATFAPELLQALQSVARKPATWFTLEPNHLERTLEAVLTTGEPIRVPFAELQNIAEIFAGVVDFKSRFTQEHSRGVARVARLLGELCGLPERDCSLLEVAGLLHDIGKLRVPDAILDKPRALTRAEAAAVTRHPFETYCILGRITCVPELAPWASFHHETLTGEGYPFRLSADALPTQARIVAVADVVQALVQDRPYRGPLPPDRALAALRGLGRSRRLDAALVAVVADHLDACLDAARGVA